MSVRLAVATCCLVLAGGCRKRDSLPPYNPRPGSIEFTIVANDDDDAEAIKAAEAFLKSLPDNAIELARFNELAENGEPPSPPVAPPDSPFQVNEEAVSYRWVEIDEHFIKGQDLKNSEWFSPENYGPDPKRVGNILGRFLPPGSNCVIWIRPHRNEKSKFDYFMLIREQPAHRRLTEANLKHFDPTTDPSTFLPSIAGQFDEEGAERMRAISTQNRPSRDKRVMRHLAIIIQGKVFDTPFIQATIGAEFTITGENFTEEYVREVIGRVRTAGQ